MLLLLVVGGVGVGLREPRCRRWWWDLVGEGEEEDGAVAVASVLVLGSFLCHPARSPKRMRVHFRWPAVSAASLDMRCDMWCAHG